MKKIELKLTQKQFELAITAISEWSHAERISESGSEICAALWRLEDSLTRQFVRQNKNETTKKRRKS